MRVCRLASSVHASTRVSHCFSSRPTCERFILLHKQSFPNSYSFELTKYIVCTDSASVLFQSLQSDVNLAPDFAWYPARRLCTHPSGFHGRDHFMQRNTTEYFCYCSFHFLPFCKAPFANKFLQNQ